MPSEAQLRAYYRTYSPSENRADQLPFLDAQARARLAFFSDLLQRFQELTVLDVGAGYGCIASHLAASAPSLVYDAIEWDTDAVRHLRENAAVNDVLMDLAESRRQYDLAILAHVLEHVPQPGRYLKRLRSHLNAQSLLFIELPNQDFRFKDSNEPHLVFFSPATIRVLLERHGFKVLRSETFGVPASELEAFWGAVDTRKEEIRRMRKLDSEKGKRMLREFMDDRRKHLERMQSLVDAAGPDRQWIRLVASVA
jgi:SAM-dependent methyltransferase